MFTDEIGKAVVLLTTIKNPLNLIPDRLGLVNKLCYKTNSGLKVITRSKTNDINEAVVVLSGKEYPEKILGLSDIKFPVVIDAGAHIGTFSLLCKLINPKTNIFAIEPHPDNLEILKQNLVINKANNIQIIPYALSDKKETTKLWFKTNKYDGATVQQGSTQNKSFVEVKTITLKEIAMDKKIDILKMDIEGAEYEILKKEAPRLSQRVNKLVLEYHDKYHQDGRNVLVKLLKKNGFQLFYESGHILGFRKH